MRVTSNKKKKGSLIKKYNTQVVPRYCTWISGCFDTTLKKIVIINAAGIRSFVMTTVSGTNIDEIPGIIDAVVAAGVNVYAFARYCPTSEEKDTNIEPLRYRKLLNDCDKIINKHRTQCI